MPRSEIGPRANRTVTVNGSVGRYTDAVADVLLGVKPLSSLQVNGAARAQEEAKNTASSLPGASGRSATRKGLTQADVATATTLATQRERRRVDEVFASPASKGRERGCATLLTADKSWTSAAIIAELPSLPTDKELESADRKKGQAKADAAWDRANAKIGRTAPPKSSAQSDPAPAAAAASADPWKRAYGRIQKERRS